MKYELKLDIDSRKLPEKEIAKRLYYIRKILKYTKLYTFKNRTKHGWHIRIVFHSDVELDDKDIVFLQLLLLSDYKREIFGWMRIRSGIKSKWNVLFSAKTDSNGKVISNER